MRVLFAVGVLIGIVSAAEPSFDVASIKPSVPGSKQALAIQPGGRFVANGVSLRLLIGLAWHLQNNYQLAGADGWIADESWSIEAKAEDMPEVPAWSPPNLPEVVAVRIRSLLTERFALKTHQEMRTLPVYRLTVGPAGPRLETADSSTSAGGIRAGPGAIIASKVTMGQFIVVLGRYMDRPLVDKTGVTGPISAKLQFAPESAPRQLSGAAQQGSAQQGAAGEDPSLFTAIQEQLGLKLETGQEPFQILVIDHVERPSTN